MKDNMSTAEKSLSSLPVMKALEISQMVEKQHPKSRARRRVYSKSPGFLEMFPGVWGCPGSCLTRPSSLPGPGDTPTPVIHPTTCFRPCMHLG